MTQAAKKDRPFAFISDWNNHAVYVVSRNGSIAATLDLTVWQSIAAGDVAVTNVTSTSYGPGSVVFYAKGATSPTNTIVADGRFAGITTARSTRTATSISTVKTEAALSRRPRSSAASPAKESSL